MLWMSIFRFAATLLVFLIATLLLFAIPHFPPVVQEVLGILILTGGALLVARMIDATPPSALSVLPLLFLAALVAAIWLAVTVATAQTLMAEPVGRQVGTADMLL
jgi:hypothetical protein